MPYSDLKVCRSFAGYYLGRDFVHGPDDECPGLVEPGSRESDYFDTEAEAQLALVRGFVPRDCSENDHGYDAVALPDLRKGERE